MKLGNPHLWVAFFSTVGVVCVAVVDTGKTSPGELTLVHGRESELAGQRDCSQCHGGWTQTMAQACLDCHEDIEVQMDAGDGLHGVLGEDATSCARCHSDHHGAGFRVVNLQSFVLAGFESSEEFDHVRIGFPMDGAHLELDCSECHEHADADVLPKGARRYIGLDQDCAACHEDPHEGRMALACNKCHGQEEFEDLHSDGHETRLALVGGHGELGCRECHAEETRFSLERVGGRGPKAPVRACVDCHESPHASPFIAGVARLVSNAPGASCITCHEAEHVSFVDEDLELSRAQHACSGFRLNEPHGDVACADCHDGPADDFAARYPGRRQDDCHRCHDDPHGGQFAEGPFARQGCVACHDRHRFEPHAFDLEAHALTAFELDGTHVDVDCQVCHELPAGDGGSDGARVFRGTPSRCERCHEDAHEGFFETLGEELADLDPDEAGECSVCHTTTSFDDVTELEFQHERWTGFPVLGAHAQSDCESCHPRSESPDDLGRTFGRVVDHFGALDDNGRSCEGCHENPHQDTFDGPRSARVVDGRTGCARCHVETSFRSFPHGFQHRRWTGFSLKGAHEAAACSACHPPSSPDELGRTWAPAAGRLCNDCHDDPHAGQFERRGRIDCSRCHDSSDGFAENGFDHDRDSRFPLGEAHLAVDCASCHQEEALTDGSTIVRYRPLPRGCTDCHGEQEQPLRRRRRRRNR